MKSKAKIDKLAHKYALDISKFHEKTTTKIDFNNLNKDFYGDIQKNDTILKSEKIMLNKIKGKTFKEFIYSNKIIPDFWKNKLDYQYEMTNLISKDKKLLSYIGSFPTNNLNSPNLPKIKNLKNNDSKYSTISNTKKRTFRFKYNEVIDDDDNVKSIMNDYKTVYPIKEKLENLMKEYSSLNNEEISKNNNLINDIENNPNNTDNKNYLSYIKKINLEKIKEKLKKQRAFRQNIFCVESLKPKFKTIFDMKNIKTRNRTNKKKLEIFNKNIEKDIKSINNYGPHFSFCPSCKSKNIFFYNNMEPNQCLELINHIKSLKNLNKIDKIQKIKRSASVPKLSLFNEKDSSESESMQNPYRIYF